MTGRRGLLAVATLLVALVVGSCGSTDGAAVDGLEVSGAWVRSTPPGAENGVAYLSIVSPVDDRLLGAEVPPSVAGAAMVHESMLVEDGSTGGHHGGGTTGGGAEGGGDVAGEGTETTIELAAGEAVALAPGGRHVMLVELAAPLRSGEVVPITLRFEVAGEVRVEAVVSANAP